MAQAQIGGQYGVNGEWYKGGQFLANSENTVKGMNNGSSKKSTRKQQIAPFAWDIAPEGKTSIFAKYFQVWKRTTSGEMELFSGANVEYFGAEFLSKAAEAAARYNTGERWE